MVKMMPVEISDVIIRIHDIARELEKTGKYDLFGKDLRVLADRLSRVATHYDLTAEEQFAYNYARAVAGGPIGVDDV